MNMHTCEQAHKCCIYIYETLHFIGNSQETHVLHTGGNLNGHSIKHTGEKSHKFNTMKQFIEVG